MRGKAPLIQKLYFEGREIIASRVGYWVRDEVNGGFRRLDVVEEMELTHRLAERPEGVRVESWKG